LAFATVAKFKLTFFLPLFYQKLTFQAFNFISVQKAYFMESTFISFPLQVITAIIFIIRLKLHFISSGFQELIIAIAINFLDLVNS